MQIKLRSKEITPIPEDRFAVVAMAALLRDSTIKMKDIPYHAYNMAERMLIERRTRYAEREEWE